MNSVVEERAGSELASAALPEDLREWIDESHLIDLITNTAHKLIPPFVHAARDGTVSEWERLIELLTFSYATGTYASAEIDPAPFMEALSEGLSPLFEPELSQRENDLRFFRRDHRPEVARCLAEVLAESWKDHTHNIRSPAHLAFERECSPAPDFSSEANRRINTAVRMDAWSIDD
ncbi:MAG TPA: hypothetical protein VM735_13765 [Candidatus Kapabacteria bacterium]|nr:hypothetical protein [Candidatus Kapabacteria bacterium]